MQFEAQFLPTVKLWPNSGQISGIPKNPRFIKDERFEKLVKSIQDDPEMLELRECIVVPYADEFVVIAGNMRLRAAIEVIGISDDDFADLIDRKQNDENFNSWMKSISRLRSEKSIFCKILPIDTPIEKIKAYIIKDNVSFGNNDYELLANDWDEVDLINWGMELVDISDDDFEEEKEKGPSVVRLTIEFDSLADYDTVKAEVSAILDSYPGAKLKESNG